MSYQRERENFLIRMAEEGVPDDVTRAVLRDAATIQRLAVVACNEEAADRDRVRCPEKYRQNGTCLCRDYGAFDDHAPDGKQHGRIPRYTVKDREASERIEKRLRPFGIVADFSGDPRGACVKLTKPSDPEWRGDDWGDPRDLCVPTRDCYAMNLQRDHSPGAYNVSVQCLACFAMVKLADAVIDRDGPAFRAYYHEHCKPDGPAARCTREGCTRKECQP